MTTAQLKTALKRFGFSDSDPLLDWLNAAGADITDAAPWPFLDVLTAGSVNAGISIIASPADLGKIKGIRRVGTTSGEKLTELTRNEFFRDISNPDATGVPEYYVLTGLGTIQIYPVPTVNTNFQIYYRKDWVSLVNDADVPILPTKYHYNPLVMKAAAIGLMGPENEEQRATSLDSQVDLKIDKMMAFYGVTTGDDMDSVEDVMEYSDG